MATGVLRSDSAMTASVLTAVDAVAATDYCDVGVAVAVVVVL